MKALHDPHPWREILAAPGTEDEGALPPRGARLPRLFDAAAGLDRPEALSACLAGLDLTIVGIGSLGMRVAFECARLGVGTLRLVDPGELKETSPLTYPVTSDAVGRAKVEHAGDLCKRISPSTRVLVAESRVEELDLIAFLETDCFVLAPDLLAPEVVVGRLARLLARPLVRAAVHGGMLVAQLRSYDGAAGGACAACFFGDREWQDVYRQTRYSCDGAEVGRRADKSGNQPTRSFGFLCALAADLAVLEVLRRLLSFGRRRGDALVEYRGHTHEIVETPLPRNPDCPGEHRALERVAVPAPFGAAPLGELLALAGIEEAELGDLTLDVDRRPFVERARCACSSTVPYGRFSAPGASLGACAACGAERAADPLTLHHEVPGEVLAPFLHRSLAELGVPRARTLVVRGETRALLHAAS